MASRIARKSIIEMANINATDATHATYFPFVEDCKRLYYSFGECGWTANLFLGIESKLYYCVEDLGNEDACKNYRLRDSFGVRENLIVSDLACVYEIYYRDCGRVSIMRFVSFHDDSFYVITYDFGKTWKLVPFDEVTEQLANNTL